MNNDSIIYLVKPMGSRSMDELFGTFDSLIKATNFVERFKTIQKNIEISTLVINPSYYTAKTTDPYFIMLDKLSTVPNVLFICSSILMAEHSRNESFHIFFNAGHGEDAGILHFNCLAVDEKEAISKAILKRDSLINSGEWEGAWESFHSKD